MPDFIAGDSEKTSEIERQLPFKSFAPDEKNLLYPRIFAMLLYVDWDRLSPIRFEGHSKRQAETKERASIYRN